MTEANLSLNNVKLKQDAFIKFDMPVNIEYGEIKNLDVRIPWLNIGSKPVLVSIEGLNIIVSLQKREMWKVQDIFDRTYLEQTFQDCISKVEAELTADDQQGYFSKLAMKVLDNIQIKIKDIHVRFEDHFTSNSQSYSFGIILKLLEVQTTNENWVAQFVDRTQQKSNQNLFKMAVIQGLAFYLNPNEQLIIHQQTSAQDKRLNLLNSLTQEKSESFLSYLLRPMNLKLQIEHQTKGLKKMNVNVSLETLHLTFLRSQLRCLNQFLEILSDYRQLQTEQYKTKKFRFLRPMQEKITRNNVRQWWQYAYQSVKKDNKAKNGSIREFVIPKKDLINYEFLLKGILDLYCHKKESGFQLQLPTTGDLTAFTHIMSSVDNQKIKAWTKNYLQSVIQKKQEEQSKGSFTSWFLGSSKKESRSEIITDQEIEAIDKEIENIPDYNGASMTLHLQLSIKDSILDLGTTNEFGIIEGIRIYKSGTLLSFKQQPKLDLQFDMDCSINDFGIDLFSITNGQFNIQESIIVSNRKIYTKSQEDQWKIKIRKRPEEFKDIDYDIQLQANPLLLKYHQEFVKRAILLSKIGINEETQNAAIEKIEDIKEATSNQIYTIIYKKANRIIINIASPIIVLPLSADSNRDSPLWVLRLGDLKVVSHDSQMTTSVVEYERYALEVNQIRMQFYHSVSQWENYLDKLVNLRDRATVVKEKNEKVFPVLEDCWMKFDIAIKQKKAGQLILTSEQLAEHHIKPKLIIQGTSSDVKINLTHSIYNKLVNLGDIFDITKDEEFNQPIVEEQIENKQAVLKNAKKIGQVMKRLDLVNQWESYFCVLSGGYLYFYKDSSQIMPSTYYYVKGGQIIENIEDSSYPNNFQIKTRFGDICLSVPNEAQQKEWISKIRERIYEIKVQEEQEYNQDGTISTTFKGDKRKKQINHSAVATKFDFSVPQFSTLLVDELKQYKEWVKFKMSFLQISNTKRKTDQYQTISVKEISLIDLTMSFNSNLIGKNQQYQTEDSLFIIVHTIQKQNPDYKNVNSETIITLKNLIINLQPNSINDVIKFFNNTKPGCSYNLLEDDERNFSRSLMESRKSESTTKSIIKKDEPPIKKPNCKQVKEVQSIVKVTLQNTSLTLLHQEYNMEIYRLDSSIIEIDYIAMYDHMIFKTRFKDAYFYDLTGYPYTINPKIYAQDPQKFKLVERSLLVINPEKEDEYGLSLHYEGYEKGCCLKKKGYHSKLSVNISRIVIEFFNEAFMRFFFYLFEQFLNSLIYTDPYCDPLKEEFELLKRRKTMRKETVKLMADFQQDPETMEMDVKLTDLSINIPDRPSSKNFLALKVEKFQVSQHLRLKAGRISTNKDKELYVKQYRMNAENSQFIFSGDIPLTEQPFNMQIIFEGLQYSPIFSKIDPSEIDQSSNIRIRFEPVQLKIRQDIYTQILRIMDLNFNFTDFLEREYYFMKYFEIEEYFKTLADIVGMNININFKCLSLKLEHIDKSFLSDLMLVNSDLQMTKFRDFKNILELKIQNLFIFDKPQPQMLFTSEINEIFKMIQYDDCVFQPKSVRIASKKQGNEIFINQQKKEQKEQQLVLQMVMKPNGEQQMNIEIQGLRITIKPHILMMVYYFMLNSFPEYDENSIDKPSYYDFDPEAAPKLEIRIDTKESLLVFQNRPGLKTLACKGRIIFEMSRQNIKEAKKAMENGLNTDNQEAKILNGDEQLDFEQFLPAQDKIPSSQPVKPQNDIIWQMRVKIEDFCPFVCSLAQLSENKRFDKINKRQLMTPFGLTYFTSYRLENVQNFSSSKKADQHNQSLFTYGVHFLQDLSLEKIKAKISLQDMHLMFQIVTYANHNISTEYIKKLEKIEQFLNNQRMQKLEEVEKFDRKKTFRQDFGIIAGEQYDAENDQDDNIDEQDKFAQILNQQFNQTIVSQVQRFRSTTKAFKNMANKYTIVAFNRKDKKKNKGQKLVNASQRDMTLSYNQFFGEISKEEKSITPTNLMSGTTSKHYRGTDFLTGQTIKQSRFTQLRPKQTSSIKHTRESEDEAFQDARSSEMFYSAHEQREGSKTAPLIEEEVKVEEVITKMSIQEKQSNKQLLISIEEEEEQVKKENEINQIQQKKEKIVYQNCLENVFTEEWTYQTSGIQILFINDYDNVFCPVIDIDIPYLIMRADNEKNKTSTTNLSIQKMKVFYFNALIGDWEPFIENFQVDYELIQSENANTQIFANINFPQPININLTEQCLQNLIESYYSWMETPPFQYDDYQNIHQKNKSSINEIASPDKQLLKSSNTGSINDDQNYLDPEQESDEQMSSIENYMNTQSKLLNNENFNKVSPYSIKNLTSYQIKVIGSNQVNLLEQFDEEYNEQNNSFMEKRDLPMSQRLSCIFQDVVEVAPNNLVDYSVDLDKQSNNLLAQNLKKIGENQFRNRASTLMTQGNAAAHLTGNLTQQNPEYKKRFRNQELVTLVFDNFEDIKNIDLNKIAQGTINLIPRYNTNSSSNLSQNDLNLIRQGSSTAPQQVTSDDENSPNRQSKSVKSKRKSKFIVLKDHEILKYGVVLNKMRKILTIRQEYIIENKTQYDYIIRISHFKDLNCFKEYELKSGLQFGINSMYYKNYTIQLKFLKSVDTDMSEELKQEDQQENLIYKEELSQPIYLDDITKANTDSYSKVMNHDGNLFTYLRKIPGQIKDTFDIALQPPISIKNNLPCSLEIKTAEEGQIFQFEKEDEKHLHVIDYQGQANYEELTLRFKVSGFTWTNVVIKRKINQNEQYDMEVKIKDINGYNVSICIRVQQSKAGFDLYFYAYTVIINQSSNSLSFFYNTLNKQMLAGQDLRQDYCLANKEDALVASLCGRYSKGLQIKNPGLTEVFSIQTALVNVTQDEETVVRSQKGGVMSTFNASERKYEFVYRTYMSLVSESESIYTKIVCISPRYVVVNKLNRAICIAQFGNEFHYDVIECGERREWVWQDSNLDDYLIIKKEDENIDRDWGNPNFADKVQKDKNAIKWLWSDAININDTGLMTIAIKKNVLRFNNNKGCDFVKVLRKEIDGTKYIIFEEEDDSYPLYRVENLCSDAIAWYVQKGQNFCNEAIQLLPLTANPFAFIDPKKQNQEIQVFFTKEKDLGDPKYLGEGHLFSFAELGQRKVLNLEHLNLKINVTVKTDGCSRIIRFSDKTVDQEEKIMKQIRLNAQKIKTDNERQSAQSETQLNQKKVTKTVKININEVLISFVSKITEREEKIMKSVRKEIAILSIQGVLLDKFSSTEQNVDNNKIQIQTIQIDNQSAVNPLFPTILQPRLFKHNEKTPMIDIDINLKTDNPEITYIELLDFKFSGMVIKLDDRFLGYILSFANDLMNELKTNLTGLHPIFKQAQIAQLDSHLSQNTPNYLHFENQIDQNQERKETAKFGQLKQFEGVMEIKPQRKMTKEYQHQADNQNNNHSNRSSATIKSKDSTQNDGQLEQYKDWRAKKIEGNNKRIFIWDCKLSSLKIELSFLARKSITHIGGKSAQSQIHSNLNSWGLTLINIDQAPIKVNHFHKKQFFGLQEDITSIISTHYQGALKKNLLSLIGSTALLGNPTKFLNTLGNGLSDFKNMPLNRRNEGVSGFMKGAFFGTVSLMKNTVEGTFGFAQTISGSMSKLLLVANIDDDYLGVREEKLLTEKPRDVIEGVGYGCQTAVDSLKSGIVGVVYRPYVGATREGAWGFFKGVYSGASGVLLKPLSGGLDLISKSTEGIKNTVKIFEKQLFKDRRRLPRTFYGYEEQIKSYHDMDSYIIIRILETLEGPFKKDHYIETININNVKDSRARFLVLSEEHLVLLDVAQKSLKWHIDSKMIKQIEKFQNGLMIYLTQKYDGRTQVPIEINNPKILQKVFEKLKLLENEQLLEI